MDKTRRQPVIVYNLFSFIPNGESVAITVGKLIIGYTASLVPMGLLVTFCLFFRVDQTLCYPLRSQFLLDNNVELAHGRSFSEIYEARKEYHNTPSSDILMFNHIGIIPDLMWRTEPAGSPYMPLNNISGRGFLSEIYC